MRPHLALVFAVLTSLVAQRRAELDGEWTVNGKPIMVPGAWENVLGADFDGVARYRHELPLGNRAGVRRVRIEFAAVATRASVLVNGEICGEHLGGWTPFRVDVTDALRWDGDDVLEVVVDEMVGHNTQGFLPVIQPHFGGIWQSVTLCVDHGPAIDRLGLRLFGRYDPATGAGTLDYEVPVLDLDDETEIRLVLSGRSLSFPISGDSPTGRLEIPDVRPWAPATPERYRVEVQLHRAGRHVDSVTRHVGFRSLAADGTRVLWNGEPLQLRGILHWGYSPPHLAPPSDRRFWRRQLLDFKRLGFNCVKCCLWVPPRSFYEECDELGMIVWQEYPTWHPKMDQRHKAELLREYREFFAHDRTHACVGFRSITCETGHGADLDVVEALFRECKAHCPESLVVDDSSWIGWQRVTDFWDEHPYGNNSWFPGRLEDFKAHIASKGRKPLLLGECIAADTWSDQGAFTARHGDGEAWWRPLCWESQTAAEASLAREFGQATVDSLLPESLAFGMRNRKFQIECLRLSIPEAGYVVSVARDFAKARMGLYDDQDRMKWSRDDWAWHRDTMLCLDLPWNRRCQDPSAFRAPVRVSHFGRGRLHGELRIGTDASPDAVRVPITLRPGETSAPVVLAPELPALETMPVRVTAELTGTHPASNEWELWVTPPVAAGPHEEVLETDRLTPELLERIESGARVLLTAGDRPGSPRTTGMWFLKGAPFAPPHPLHERLPKELLLAMSSFDLESGRVMPWEPWQDEVDPILAFWETHDIAETRMHLHAFTTRIGDGRLAATTFRPDGHLGAAVRFQLCEHLKNDAAPQRALSAATLEALRRKLTEKKLDLPVWRFAMDPGDRGRELGWQDPATDVTGDGWRDLRAGSHWENQGEDLRHFTGIGWYRVDVEIPPDWLGLDVRAVFEGVDDSFELWLDGAPAGSFGDPVTKTTIWLEEQVAELEPLSPGRHTLVLRVVDHAGAGGLWKPVYLTTGPTGPASRLLH